MKINKSYLFAAAAFLAIALWFWYNSAKADTTTAPTKPAAEQSTSIPTVVVESRNAEDHQNSFTLYGRSEANREVDVKAETAGLVVSTPVREGQFVKRGTVLCRQDIDARQANLDQAQATLEAREFDLQSTPDYKLKGGVTATVKIKSGTVKAQHVPSKILTLDTDGAIGVRFVDYDNRVGFAVVTQIDEDADGIWVTGLPDSTRIIVQGQDFVSVGTEVEPKMVSGAGAGE